MVSHALHFGRAPLNKVMILWVQIVQRHELVARFVHQEDLGSLTVELTGQVLLRLIKKSHERFERVSLLQEKLVG